MSIAFCESRRPAMEAADDIGRIVLTPKRSMAPTDYLIILLAFLLYRPLKTAVHVGKARMAHDWSDMFGIGNQNNLRLLDRYFLNRWVPPVTLTLMSFGAYPWMNWSTIDPTQSLRFLIGLASIMLAWKSATYDIDLATGRQLIVERCVVVLAAIGVIVYPGFLFLLLFTAVHYFRGWQHHQHLQIRIILFFLATWIGYLILQPLGDLPPMTSAAFFVVLVVTGSHYLIPGIAKLQLGPHWYSWMSHNRLDYLPLTAYMWGWCSFIPENGVVRWLRPLRVLNRPLQIFAIAFEIGAVFTLFDRHIALLILGSAFLFHATVFILAGLLFWQTMAMLMTLVGIVLVLPDAIGHQVFGPANGVLAFVLMIALPLGLRLWRPVKLAWWDTPLIARTDWTVEGASGKLYGLYNDFMEPNDRIFGNSSGYFLSKRKRLTNHMGHTENWEVAEAIYGSLSTPERLEEVAERLGRSKYKEEKELEHDRYMSAFLTNYNRGKPKRVCPKWLKAPGGQLFYWGRLPRFRGQEPVKRLIMHYREELFDGTRIVTLRNEFLKTIEISFTGDAEEVNQQAVARAA